VAYPSIVSLQVLNYGYMGVKGVDTFKETQREVLFSVPLLWFEADAKGAYEFHKKRYRLNKLSTANVTPFVFVDNRLSLWGGREIYGWPKALMNVQPDISRWMTDPLQERSLVTIYGSLLEKEDPDERPHYRPILEISQEVDTSLHFENPEQGQSPAWIKNLEQINRTMTDSYSQAINLWQYALTQSAPMPSHIGELADTSSDISSQGSLTTHEIGLKQFRDAADPTDACYMSIGYSTSTVTRVNGAGLLATVEKSSQQLSGGFKIRIHEYETKPIVTTLGLKLVDLQTEDGHPVGIAEPIMPMWLDFNSSYGGAESMIEIAHGHVLGGQLDRDAYPPFESEYFDPEKPWKDDNE
jgi:hypothetical protein